MIRLFRVECRRDLTRDLTRNHGAIQISTDSDLAPAIQHLSSNPTLAAQTVANGQAVLQRHLGATLRTTAILRAHRHGSKAQN